MNNSINAVPPFLKASRPTDSHHHHLSQFVSTFPTGRLPPSALASFNIPLESIEQNLHYIQSRALHHENAFYDMTAHVNNASGHCHVENEHSPNGIPQFQHKLSVTPNGTSGYQHHLPYAHQLTPKQSQIFPFENFISPSEQQNSESHFGSIPVDYLVDEFEHFNDNDILWRESSLLPHEELSRRHLHDSNYNLHLPGDHQKIFNNDRNQTFNLPLMDPSQYQDTQDSTISAEWFNILPSARNQPKALDRSGHPADQYSERNYETNFNNSVPPFKNYHKLRNDPVNDTRLALPKKTNTNEAFQQHQEHPVPTTTTKSYEFHMNPGRNLTLPSNVAVDGTNLHSFHLSPGKSVRSSTSDHIEYPIVRHPKPIAVTNHIRFFNEGIEVDINNRPISQPNSTIATSEKLYVADLQQESDCNLNDDFDLVGKTSLWGGL
jgi:hypothetical protein